MRNFSIAKRNTIEPVKEDKRDSAAISIARLTREVFLWQQRYKALQAENYRLHEENIRLTIKLEECDNQHYCGL